MAFPPQKPRSALSSMQPMQPDEPEVPGPDEQAPSMGQEMSPQATSNDPNLMSLYGSSLEGPELADIAHFYENPVVDNPAPFDDFQVPINDQDFYDPVEGPLSGRPSEYGHASGQAGKQGMDYKKQGEMADMLAMRAQERKAASQGFQDNVRSLNKKAKGGY